jgi:hypothetical protein
VIHRCTQVNSAPCLYRVFASTIGICQRMIGLTQSLRTEVLAK